MSKPMPKRKKISAERENLSREVMAVKREAILREASSLFFEQGYVGTSVDEIAERLGVTKPFIYYHFDSKLDLLTEICQRGTRDALAATNDVIEAPGSAASRLHKFVHDFAAGVLDNQQYVTIYFREEIHLDRAAAARINNMRKSIDRNIRHLLLEGMESGEFDVQDPEICTLAINGMVSYAFAWYRKQGRLDKGQIARELADLVLRMVCAGAAGNAADSAVDRVSAA